MSGSPEVSLSLAGPADEALVVELMREFYAVEHLAFEEPATRNALREILGNGAIGRVFLIRSRAETAGYLVLTFGFSLEFHGRDALIDELYLREDHRGKGFGRAALQHVEDVCRLEGIRALHLEVDRVNTRAQQVYRKAGYQDHDRYLLTKWLEL